MISSFGFVMFLGIAPYGYSFKRKIFIPYVPLLIYGIAISIIFSAYYLPEVYNEFLNYEDERDISKIYSAMNILSAVVSYVVLIAYHRGIVDFLNKAQIEFFTMKSYVESNIQESKFKLFQFGAKAAVFPMILWTTITFKHLYSESHDGESTLTHLKQGYMTMIPYMIRSAPSTCLYGILLLTSFYMKQLIANAEIMVREINLITFHKELKIHKNFYKMQRFCELSDLLDDIAIKYTQILKSTRDYVSFVEIPWIASLGCNMIGVTYGIFAQYTYIANTVFDDEPYDVASVFTGTIFILVSAMEIFLQANIATENTNMVSAFSSLNILSLNKFKLIF